MNKLTTTLVTATFAAGVFALPAPAQARGGDDASLAGSCTGSSTTKIKARPRDGHIEAEFEVDQNQNGVTWRVKLLRNGAVVWHGNRTTHGPSGSFTVDRNIADGAGSDKITGRAVNPATGEVCRASVTV